MRVRNNDFATLRIKRIPYLFAGYQKVFRCKSCGKIYPEYVPGKSENITATIYGFSRRGCG